MFIDPMQKELDDKLLQFKSLMTRSKVKSLEEQIFLKLHKAWNSKEMKIMSWSTLIEYVLAFERDFVKFYFLYSHWGKSLSLQQLNFRICYRPNIFGSFFVILGLHIHSPQTNVNTFDNHYMNFEFIERRFSWFLS